MEAASSTSVLEQIMAFPRRSKFNARKVTFQGKTYHSQQECNDAIWLDSLLKQKKVKKIERQHKIDIRVNGVHIANHFVDFLVTLLDDRQKYVETKGFPTDVWLLKKKLVEATETIPYLVNPTEKDLLS